MSRLKLYPPFYNALRYSPDIKFPKKKKIEENNNDIEVLTNGIRKMGNITKNLRRKDKESSPKLVKEESKCDEDYDYDFDEFEEDCDGEKAESEQRRIDNDDEKLTPKEEPRITKIEVKECETDRCLDLQTSDRHRETCRTFTETPTKNYINTSRTSSRASFSHCSSLGRSRRLNMSFTNDRAKDIDRENKILLKKILRSKTTLSQTENKKNNSAPRVSSATVIRKRAAEKAHHENMILLNKIQNAKSSNLSWRR